MNDTGRRGRTRGVRTSYLVLRALVVVAVLPLPIAAYLLGVYALPRAGAANPAQHLLRDQVLLVLTGLVVSGVGGFLIWNTATSLAQAAALEAAASTRNRPAGGLPESASLSSSVTRMLGAIERESDETNQFDSIHGELESARARLEEASSSTQRRGAAADALDPAQRAGRNGVAEYGESGAEPAETREVEVT